MVRSAELSDLKAVVPMIRDLAVFEGSEAELTGSIEDLQRYLFGSERCAELFVACEFDLPVGFVISTVAFSAFACKPMLYVEHLFVYPQHRGKGYGKALMAAVADSAIGSDCYAVMCDVYRVNTAAQGFYQRLGLRPIEQLMIHEIAGSEMERLAALHRPPVG